jgi:hypothetical protein
MDFSKFDQLIYYTEESDLSKTDIVAKVQELFPKFDPDSDCYFDKHLTEYTLDKYYYNRSLGLPIAEVAQSISMSVTLLSMIFQGERVSLKCLLMLAKAETFALAEMKATHLSFIEKADGMGATVTFLEKAFSAQYGDRKKIDISTGFEEKESNAWSVTVHHVDNKIKEKSDIASSENAELIVKDEVVQTDVGEKF